MSTALLVAAIAVGVLACPTMMWWQGRRGRRALCCPPMRAPAGDDRTAADEVTELHRRQAVLAARVAALRPDSSLADVHAPGGDG